MSGRAGTLPRAVAFLLIRSQLIADFRQLFAMHATSVIASGCFGCKLGKPCRFRNSSPSHRVFTADATVITTRVPTAASAAETTASRRVLHPRETHTRYAD